MEDEVLFIVNNHAAYSTTDQTMSKTEGKYKNLKCILRTAQPQGTMLDTYVCISFPDL